MIETPSPDYPKFSGRTARFSRADTPPGSRIRKGWNIPVDGPGRRICCPVPFVPPPRQRTYPQTPVRRCPSLPGSRADRPPTAHRVVQFNDLKFTLLLEGNIPEREGFPGDIHSPPVFGDKRVRQFQPPAYPGHFSPGLAGTEDQGDPPLFYTGEGRAGRFIAIGIVIQERPIQIAEDRQPALAVKHGAFPFAAVLCPPPPPRSRRCPCYSSRKKVTTAASIRM